MGAFFNSRERVKYIYNRKKTKSPQHLCTVAVSFENEILLAEYSEDVLGYSYKFTGPDSPVEVQVALNYTQAVWN